MKFDDLDARMRVFETAHDHCVLPGIYAVARLDGRGFTRLTKEVQDFEAPFDERFRDLMAGTTEHLMQGDFRFIYGYTQSDEISLLFHQDEGLFGRKVRKWNSILAAEASAFFSLALGSMGCFDCRISQLPRTIDVRDYFRWRHEDAHRNALSAHCYWALRKEGASVKEATARLVGASTADKNELLFQRGINFNDLPAWQRRGIGFQWSMVDVVGRDPRTGTEVQTKRRRLIRDMELPIKDAYSAYIEDLLSDPLPEGAQK